MKEIKVEEWNENPFKVIGKDWMLVTAEKEGRTNIMTASWGGVGIMWGKNVATIYVRQSRYTKDFIDASGYFSLCVLDEKYRSQLALCGKVSGRNEDKIKACGFTVEKSDEVPYIGQSRLVLVCRKLYSQKMDPSCLMSDEIREMCWPDEDVHQMYIAEIERILAE